VLAVGPASAGEQTCGDAVFADWQEGGIDGVYAPACYREALQSLPEDVRVYSSAPEDIARAYREALTARGSRTLSGHPSSALAPRPPSPAAATTPAGRDVPLPILVAGLVVVLVVLAGTSSLLAERRRVRRLARRGP
jgi:hypothetical protein